MLLLLFFFFLLFFFLFFFVLFFFLFCFFVLFFFGFVLFVFWKPTQPRIRFDLEKLNDPTVLSAFQATIGGRFAPLATQVDEDADLDSMVTHFNKAVTDTAAELLGKQRRKRKQSLTGGQSTAQTFTTMRLMGTQ